MRKLFLLFLFFILSSIFVSAQYEKLTHYNIHSDYLDLEHLGGQSFIAYGSNGNVLRTENSFETWEQEFSGIHNDILKVHYENEILYGITRQGDFIWSLDKGNHWQFKKISEGLLTDFYSDNGTFYISKYTDSIMYSNDYGQTWQSMYVTNDTLRAVFSIDNQIIVNKNYKELLIFKDNEWTELELPSYAEGFPFLLNRKKNNNLYLFTSTQVARLEPNLTWREFNLKESSLSDVVETETELICFAYNGFSKKAKVVYYDKSTDEVIKKEEFNDPNLHQLCHGLDYGAIDANGNLIVTSPGKTIFTKNVTDENWNTKTSFMIPLADAMKWYYIKNKNNWVYNSTDGNFVKTTDGGVSFQIGQYFKNDTISEGNIIRRNISHVEYKSLDTVVVYFMSGDSLAKSVDGGMTFQKEFIEKKGLWRANKFDDFDGFSVYTESFTQFEDYTLFYKVVDGEIIDTLIRFDNLILKNLYKYEDKLLILSDLPDENILEYYLTDTEFKNPEKIYSFNYNSDNHHNSTFRLDEYLVAKDNKIYIMFRENLRKNNVFSYSLTKVFKIDNFDVNPILIYNKPIHLFNYNVALGENKLVTIGIQDTNTLDSKHYLGRTIINDGFQYEILGKLESGFMRVYHALNDNSSFFYDNQGHFWKLIEEDRIPTNVVEENRPPAIWTYPPYPNPAIDQTKIQFYSGVMNDVNSLQLKVVNISTGQEIKGLDYTITVNNNWNGTLTLETNILQSGSYLLEFKLGDRTTTEKLVIIK